jgi:hypothetical protein
VPCAAAIRDCGARGRAGTISASDERRVRLILKYLTSTCRASYHHHVCLFLGLYVTRTPVVNSRPGGA